MRLIIEERDEGIYTFRDFDSKEKGLIAQFIVELELMKEILIELYEDKGLQQ